MKSPFVLSAVVSAAAFSVFLAFAQQTTTSGSSSNSQTGGGTATSSSSSSAQASGGQSSSAHAGGSHSGGGFGTGSAGMMIGSEMLCVDVQFDKQSERMVDQMVMQVSQQLQKSNRLAMTMKSSDIAVDRIYFYGKRETAMEELWYLELSEKAHTSPVHGWKITMMPQAQVQLPESTTAAAPAVKVDKP